MRVISELAQAEWRSKFTLSRSAILDWEVWERSGVNQSWNKFHGLKHCHLKFWGKWNKENNSNWAHYRIKCQLKGWTENSQSTIVRKFSQAINHETIKFKLNNWLNFTFRTRLPVFLTYLKWKNLYWIFYVLYWFIQLKHFII